MTIKCPVRVLQTTNTLSTGPYSLNGAATQNRNFHDAYPSGASVPYVCTDNTGNYEIGIGTLTVGTTDTIARTTILLSSNSNAAVVWDTGTRDIFAFELGNSFYMIPFTATTLNVGLSDWGNCYCYTGSVTSVLNLPQLSTVPVGYTVSLKNSGTATVTVTPCTGDEIEALGTNTGLPATASVGYQLASDGTVWRAFAGFQIPIPNSSLANSSVTIAGHSISLGGTQTLAAADLTNGTTGSGAVTLQTSATLDSPTLYDPEITGTVSGAGTIPNSVLVNSSVTIAGHSISLGGSQALAASDLTNGVSGSGNIVLSTSPLLTQTGSLPNLLINPSFEIDQANEGSSVSLTSGTAAYIVDGWKAEFSGSASGVTGQRVADAPPGFTNSVKLTVGTGHAVGSTDYLILQQPIEADDITGMALGTSSAMTCSLQFWVKSSIASYVMSAAITNFAGTRSYPLNFTVTSSGTWTFFSATFVMDTGGTWITSGTAGGMYLVLCAAAGSSLQGTVSTWGGGNYYGTSSNTNTILSTTGATFQITGVKLEISPSPTTFLRLSTGTEFARCLRLYQKTYDVGTTVGTATHTGMFSILGFTASNVYAVTVPFVMPMRTTPTISFWDGAGNSGKSSQYEVGSGWLDNEAASIVLLSCSKNMIIYNNTDTCQAEHFTLDARL